MTRQYRDQDGAGTTLSAPASIGATSLTVTDGSILSATGPFSVRLQDATTDETFETINVTARTGNTLTCDATTLAWDVGDKVFQVVAATDLDEFVQQTDADAAYQALSDHDQFIGCRVFGSTQTLTTATSTVISWPSESIDSSGFHDPATNPSRLTVPAGFGGIYRVGGGLTFATNTTGARIMLLRVNGTTIVLEQPAAPVSGQPTKPSGHTLVPLAVGDYVEVLGYQTSGGNLALTTGTTELSFFELEFVGELP